MAPENQTGLNIKAVAERTGVPLHTLRAWERRYGIPRPNRHAANRYRLYDEDDIADVLWMKRQVQSGVSPAQASALLLQLPRERIQGDANTAPLTATFQQALYDALIQGDQAAAQSILSQVWGTFGPEPVAHEILQPTMRAIGDGWQRNLLSVEQEHFASNLVRQRLDALIQAQPEPPPNAPRLVAACAPEEQHDLGLAIFTLLARRQGWKVSYLGQRTPLGDLDHAAQGARFVVISVSTVMGLASLVPLWARPPLAAPLLFGGQVLNLVPGLRGHLPGKFLGEDGIQALQTLETFAPSAVLWKPARRVLRTAGALDAVRLQIANETVAQYMPRAPKLPEGARSDFRHGMNHAALFLTDALISALAFETPELMDAQGAWANEFMPAHAISIAALRDFIGFYHAAITRALPPEAAKAVEHLVLRFADVVTPNRATNDERSLQ